MSKTPKIIIWDHSTPELRVPASCTFLRHTEKHRSEPRDPHHDRIAQNAAQFRAYCEENASNPPKIMGWDHRAGERLHLRYMR